MLALSCQTAGAQNNNINTIPNNNSSLALQAIFANADILPNASSSSSTGVASGLSIPTTGQTDDADRYALLRDYFKNPEAELAKYISVYDANKKQISVWNAELNKLNVEIQAEPDHALTLQLDIDNFEDLISSAENHSKSLTINNALIDSSTINALIDSGSINATIDSMSAQNKMVKADYSLLSMGNPSPQVVLRILSGAPATSATSATSNPTVSTSNAEAPSVPPATNPPAQAVLGTSSPDAATSPATTAESTTLSAIEAEAELKTILLH